MYCRDYKHYVSPYWYDIVHFKPKPSWICSWAIPQNVSYQWRYLSILIYPWSSSFLANMELWSYTQQSSPRIKDHRASPQTIIHPFTLYQPGFFILHFTVLGLGHVHKASEEHTAYPSRADPRITPWSNWGPPLFVRHSEDSSIMANSGARL